jgi:putative transposase
MPRTAKVAPGGFVYHVLNRSDGRMHMFRKEFDFEAFERVRVERDKGS